MTEKEIIKHLEWLVLAVGRTGSVTIGAADVVVLLALINRYEAENERLREEVELLHSDYTYKFVKEKAKAEAIKDFADRLKCEMLGKYCLYFNAEITDAIIDNLVKEMTGETKTAETDFPKDYSYGY